MSAYLFPIVLVTVVGIIAGVMLTIAAKVMYVPVDERVEELTEALPGANCGGCGFAGCSDYASAIVNDGADLTSCAVGGPACAAELGKIMGVEVSASEPKVALVKCCGYNGKTNKILEYKGVPTCKANKSIYSGDGACMHGCIGLGDCVRACKFNAIGIVNGVAWVDRNNCTGCGACTRTCPNSIIELVPKHSLVYVACSSTDKGAQTRKQCTAGCIACRKCEKTCKFDSIHVVDNHAVIDFDTCKNCGMCVKVCPDQTIIKLARAKGKVKKNVVPKKAEAGC